jgi:hypothetical protein
MGREPPVRKPLAIWIFGTGVLALGVWLIVARGDQLLHARGIVKVEDFGAYWTACRLNLAGVNPHSIDDLRVLQQQIDPTREDILLPWSPPWMLAYLIPFCGLNFAVARWAWLILQTAMLFGCAEAAWRLYGGSPQRHWLAWLLAFGFYPSLQMLGLGQFSLFNLAGLLGFLHFERKGQWWRAGLCAGLAAAKPQVMFLFWLALLLWSIDRRRLAIPLGAAVTVLTLTGLIVASNPAVLGQYAEAMANHPPAKMISPTIGSFLRYLFGEERFWLAFVPAGLGTLWLLDHYRRHRTTWTWRERLPLLLFVGYLTMPYGWIYDQVILLIPLVQLSVWASERRPGVGVVLLAGFVLVNVVAVSMNVLHFEEYRFWWLAPVLFMSHLVVKPRGRAAGFIPTVGTDGATRPLSA